MKRLAILFLTFTALLVCVTAATAATVTFNGELNLGYNIDEGFQGPVTLGGYPTDLQVTTLIKVSDQISGNVLLQAKNYGLATNNAIDPAPAYPYIDQAYLTYNPGFAMFNVGRFPLNAKDNVSLLNGMLYNGDYKDGFALQILFPIAGNLTGKVWTAVPQSTVFNYNSSDPFAILTSGNVTRGDYAVSLVYTGSNFGGSINALSIAQDNYFKYSNGWGPAVADVNKGYALLGSIVAINAYIKPADAFKIYLYYGESNADWRSSDSSHTNSGSDKLRTTIFGISFDDQNVPVYLRVECDFQKGVSDQGANYPFGYLIGYKFGNGLYWEYEHVRFADDKYDAGAYNFNWNYFKFKLVF